MNNFIVFIYLLLFIFLLFLSLLLLYLRSQLKKMKNCKSCGPDGITSDMLKIAGEIIIPYLVRLFNVSINNESVPDDWKSALIVPIFKSGQKCEVQNYRPIISNSIRNHLDQTEWFFRGQHGFRNGFSCESQIISLTQDLSEVIDLGGRVDAIVIDFAKCLM